MKPTSIQFPSLQALRAMKLIVACSTIFASIASATPVQYQITFAMQYGIAPTSGSFFYDASASPGSRFTSFVVVWNSMPFNFTFFANQPYIQTTGGSCTDDAFVFLINSSGCSTHSTWQGQTPFWIAGTDPFGGTAGSQFRDENETVTDTIAIVAVYNPSIDTVAEARGTFVVSPVSEPVPEPGSLFLVIFAVGTVSVSRILRSSSTS